MKIFSRNFNDKVLSALPASQASGPGALPENICVVDAGEAPPSEFAPENTIVLIPSQSHEDLIEYAAASGAHHIIAVDHPYFARQIQHAIQMICHPLSLFSDPLKVLNFETLNTLHSNKHNVFNSSDKSQAIDAISTTLRQYLPARTVLDGALAVTDEILMNALYDAPEAAGVPAKDNTKAALLEWGYSAENLLLSVQDHWGSLVPQVLIRRLQKVYVLGMGQAMNMGSGGAGIGMRIVFEHSSSIYMSVEPGHHTQVICLLNLGKGRRARASEQKSLHISIKRNL